VKKKFCAVSQDKYTDCITVIGDERLITICMPTLLGRYNAPTSQKSICSRGLHAGMTAMRVNVQEIIRQRI